MRYRSDWRRQHQTVDAQGREAIGFSVWDRQTYTSATTVRMAFFTAVRANIRDGNLTLQGQFPANEHFRVQTIRIVPIVRPDQRDALAVAAVGPLLSAADDLAQLYNNGVLQVSILSKNYGQYPMYLLLPGTGVVANQTNFTTTAQASNYAVTATVGNPDNRAAFTLSRPITIPPVTGFAVTLEWPAAITLEAGNMDLVCVLDGEKIRPKQ